MIIERLELVDFRNYRHAVFALTAGTTVVVGDNGQGKTNFAEAMAYLGTLTSFRAAPPEALVRVGANAAIVRADVRASAWYGLATCWEPCASRCSRPTTSRWSKEGQPIGGASSTTRW